MNYACYFSSVQVRSLRRNKKHFFEMFWYTFKSSLPFRGGCRVVRWCWVNFQCRGVLLIWIRVGQGLFGHFSLNYHFSFLSPSLWETARYRLKYCLKGPLSSKQPTNQLPFRQRGINFMTCSFTWMKKPFIEEQILCCNTERNN